MERFGDFEIRDRLAEGGMATVFIAVRHGTGGFAKPVAIKVIHDQYSGEEELIKMFLDEARLSARIDHPNVVNVQELGKQDGRPFLVMELVEGCSLLRLLRSLRAKERRMSPLLAVHIASEIAAGLHAAHEATNAKGERLHIVHRDVSPSNVLISDAGFVKVCDFGVAKARFRLRRTTAHAIKGKVRYMAPEQARSEDIDRRADIYALGLVLWEMLVGRPRFAQTDPDALLREVQGPRVIRPDAFEPSVPQAVAAAVERALKPERTERFATARELRESAPRCVATSEISGHGRYRRAAQGMWWKSSPTHPVDVTGEHQDGRSSSPEPAFWGADDSLGKQALAETLPGPDLSSGFGD